MTDMMMRVMMMFYMVCPISDNRRINNRVGDQGLHSTPYTIVPMTRGIVRTRGIGRFTQPLASSPTCRCIICSHGPRTRCGRYPVVWGTIRLRTCRLGPWFCILVLFLAWANLVCDAQFVFRGRSRARRYTAMLRGC
jgi:hypothetical protein